MKKLLYILPLLVVCFFVSPTKADAAISFNTATSSFLLSVNTTRTVSFTEPGGTNDYLLVGIYLSTGASSDRIVSVTYNGVAMSQLKKFLSGGDYMYIYGLAAPATGANNLTFTTTSSTDFQTYTAVYSGVAQAGQPDSNNTNTVTGGGATSLTTATTVVAANSWLVMLGAWQQGGIGAGTGAFFRKTGGNTGSGWFDSNGAVGAGSQSMQITGSALSGGVTGYDILLSLAPAADVSTFQLWPLSIF